MKTTLKTTKELVETGACPFPLSVITHNMGINLCSIEGVSWTRQDDGQLVSLMIHFIPRKKEQ